MAPLPTVSWVAAAERIEPSVGPTHGVQATANAAPATSGPPEPGGVVGAPGRHSGLSLGTNGVSRKNRPSAMITAPATLSSVSRESLSVEPSPVAVIPSATNTTVKDRQKTIAGNRICDVLRSPVFISATVIPETALR